MILWTSVRWALALLPTFAILPCAPAENEAEAVTLGEAVELALKRHPDVEKARVAADILKGKIREVRAQALPDVSVNSGFTRWRDPSLLNASGLDKFPAELRDALVPSPVNLFDYHIALKQPIYTAGKVGTALRLASVEAEGALSDIDRARQDLALEVTRAFYGLLWAERFAELTAETQRQKQLHAEMARTRFRNGVATEVDVLRSEVAVANGAPELVRARNAVRQSRAQLNYYLARPLDFPTRPAGDFQEKPLEQNTLEALVFEAVRRRPELSRLRIAERSAGVQVDLARAESRAKVDFAATYGIMSRLPSNLANSQFTRWTAGFTFNFPVFDGFRRSALISQALGVQRTARLERQRVEEQVRLALQQGLDDTAAAEETIRAARANVSQAEKVLAMMQNNYKYGAATTLDIVDAQTAVSVARTNLLRGLHDYTVARAGLRWTAGMTPWE
ncbi:MAG TPA: TolC family protein [Bryobacteraceae bacterium]|nr:TolC family protein [Bryobacteraceae bacterium]